MGKLNIIANNIAEEIKHVFQPKDKSIVLMGAWFGNRFSDNTRYLYQYLSENKEKLGLTHVVWVTKSKQLQKELSAMGYEAYIMDSQESIDYHKKAGVHIICNSDNDVPPKGADILTRYSNGSIRINLWHGLGGIKGVSYASKEYLDYKKSHPVKAGFKEFLRKSRLFRRIVQLPGGWGDSYYLSTTPFETEIFKKYFGLPNKCFIEAGYPRNQKEVRLRECEKEVIAKLQNSNKVLLYMPTFRDNNSGYVSPLSDERIMAELKANNWLWVEKKHGADANDLLNKVENPTVLQLDSDFDANILLPHVDMIVTDYSSVSWDGLYHRKPILFYMPDYDYYMNQDRGFVLGPDEFIIGPAAYNIDEMLEILQKYQNDFADMLPENEEALFEKVWGHETNCAEIWEKIVKKCM